MGLQIYFTTPGKQEMKVKRSQRNEEFHRRKIEDIKYMNAHSVALVKCHDLVKNRGWSAFGEPISSAMEKAVANGREKAVLNQLLVANAEKLMPVSNEELDE